MNLDIRGLIDKIREVLLSECVAPVRASLTHNGVWLGAMPVAWLGFQVVKVVGVYPGIPLVGSLLLRAFSSRLKRGLASSFSWLMLVR